MIPIPYAERDNQEFWCLLIQQLAWVWVTAADFDSFFPVHFLQLKGHTQPRQCCFFLIKFIHIFAAARSDEVRSR